ncbi:phosphoribosylanthranilate isomerase [[Actinomadura] parvosata subsp. kistnae]|uniref:N-(5'-phosphoribosyl)anthranilate isomerase n=1 Tax=[Actinomadura] parvosata subsp. kistnae TaxID=1909395 RepID=A0A1V0A1I3_9ACTN|nr:phosphoribosylanthranilate isomerase [Nonomuraea sp. ATCC 55076]AQZ64086.1 phosphoribosylanthranilate isomerase [Nonomuraea sp. ATCC 55076]
MFVKICGLSQAEHVATAVGAGADAIGFVMTRSPRRVTPERAAELAAEVPGHVLTVGVFRGEDPETVRAAALTSGVRAVQLHGRHPHADFTALKDLGVTLIRAVDAQADLRCGAYDEDLLLVDAPHAGSGEQWDWGAVRGRASGRWMLAGGLAPGNVRAAIEAAGPWGVDVSSGVESAPGVKDSRLIEEFLRSVRG